MLNELGPNDWRFKAIKNAYESGNAKKVGAVVCQNPNAHWNQIEAALLDADYSDMVQFADELNLEQNNEDKMLSEVQRLQKLAGLLNEDFSAHPDDRARELVINAIENDYEPGTPEYDKVLSAVEDALDSGRIDTMGLDVEPAKAATIVRDIVSRAGLEDSVGDLSWDSMKADEQFNEGLSPLDFNLHDEVWIQSMNTYGTVVDTEVENEEGTENDLIVVELPNKEQVTVSTSDVESMENNGDSDGDHYGDDEDDASYYARRGWQSKMDEATIDFKPTVPPAKKGVDVNDFEEEHFGNLDNYIRKLVAQELQKNKNKRVIPFTPKHQ